MDKKLFRHLSQIQALDDNPCVVEPEKEIRSDSDLDRVLAAIFEVDENTGLPKSDIHYYLSSNGNPQVREWLINNLLKPRADKMRSSVDGVTDDLIFEFSRKADEDIVSYRERLYQLGEEARQFVESNKPKEE